MMVWALWWFGVLHLLLLDGYVSRLTGWLPAPALAVPLFCVLFARPGALPGLLAGAALARSVLLEGNAAVHVLILGVPVAALLPFRTVFAPGSILWQALASGFLAFMLPRVASLLFRITGEGAPVSPATSLEILLAMCVVPLWTRLLRAVPPMRTFEDEQP
ncbi:MAG: hypothetical protein KDC87_00235 [Planctomycetes bacterium]|nr:hypothetical protein [Planctomycetota bacterium]MCB9869729.1 hypothetical protein [Planctomycetota bacterium]